jgi:hypothetical protein
MVDTFYTDNLGRSKPSQLWDKYELKIIKVSADQKIVTLELIKLK